MYIFKLVWLVIGWVCYCGVLWFVVLCVSCVWWLFDCGDVFDYCIGVLVGLSIIVVFVGYVFVCCGRFLCIYFNFECICMNFVYVFCDELIFLVYVLYWVKFFFKYGFFLCKCLFFGCYIYVCVFWYFLVCMLCIWCDI